MVIAADPLTVSMFSGDPIGRWTPVLHLVTLPVCLYVVTHITIDFRLKTWAEMISIAEGVMGCYLRTSAGKVGHSSLFQRIIATKLRQEKALSFCYDINELTGAHFKKKKLWCFTL